MPTTYHIDGKQYIEDEDKIEKGDFVYNTKYGSGICVDRTYFSIIIEKNGEQLKATSRSTVKLKPKNK